MPSLLRELLNQCRISWVCDFLFTSEPIHLPALARPGLATDSVLRHVSTTRIEPEHLRLSRSAAERESSDLEGNFLYLPKVSVDDVSLGFGIMDASFSVDSDIASSSRKTICTSFRFAYCASRRMLLEVYDLASQGSVVLSYTCSESTTASRSFKARFHRQQLLAIVRQEQTAFYFAEVFCALQSFQDELQHGPCRLCGTPATAPCECRQELPLPAHPFEHGRFRKAMELGLGDFEGVAHKIFFDGGEERWDTMLGSRTSVGKLQDEDAVRRMEEWATAEYVRAKASEHALMGQGSAEVGGVGAGETRVLPAIDVELLAGEAEADQREAGGALMRLASHEIGCSSEQQASDGADAEGLGGSGEDNWPSPMGEKEVKAEIRKQKNRESALRSNRRKKALRDALELELKNCQDHVERLRRRETQLRHENLRLRRSFLDGG